jgi:hypothetical protein
VSANYKIDSANEMRKFLWNELKAEGIFDETDYYSDNVNETIIPILPVQQIPEMNQFLNAKKHIVYDKTNMTYESNWLVCTEKMQFTLYAVDVAEIQEMRNFIIDLFRRSDESARDINNFIGTSSPIRFHTIYMSDISPIAPSEEIQGFLSADVILEVKYSRDVDPSGRFA